MINGIPVIVGIATIEERKESLVDTVLSLEKQADHIHVYCNGHSWTGSNLLIPEQSSYWRGFDDLGDIGKFGLFVQPPIIPKHADMPKDCYFLTCDDDLIYPPDYVERMIEGIERYNRKAVCSFHGKKYTGPVESYYRTFNDRIMEYIKKYEREPGPEYHTANYRCLDAVVGDMGATVLGTGCAGWHSSLVDLRLEDFPHPNMADIWFSKKLNDLDIPRVVLAHEKGWIEHTDKIDTERDTIYARHYFNDEYQTEVFNSVEWRL